MNILFIVDTDWLRKTYRLHYHHIAKYLSSRGHRVYVVDYDAHWQSRNNDRKIQFRTQKYVDETTLTQVFRPSIVKLRGLDRLSIQFSSVPLLKKLINKYSIDIIITGSITYALPTMLVSIYCRIPFIYYVIDSVSSEIFVPNRILRSLSRLFEKYLCIKAAQIFVLTLRLKQHILSFGIQEDKVKIIPTGVSTDVFRPDLNVDYIRKTYGLSDKTVVLYLGAIRKGFGLEKFIESFPFVKKEVPNCVYLLVGYSRPKEYVKWLMSMAKKFDDPNSIMFLGPRPYDKVPEIISASDICIVTLPPRSFAHKAFPIKLFEYMACGKPVVCTKLDGVMSVLTDLYIRFVNYNEKSIANKLISLAQNDMERENLGRLGRNFVKRNHDWSHIADIFEKGIYETLDQIVRKDA